MSDEKTLNVYRRKAETYIALRITDAQRRAMEAFTARLPAGAHIFDLGCGPGQHAAAFMAQGFVVSALDATPEFIEAAQGLGVNARLGTFDALTERDCYDGVWASFSLLHAPRADFARHLRAAAAALKPGGLMFLGMKTGTDEGRDAIGRFYSFYSVDALRDQLCTCGLQVVWQEEGAEKGLAGTVDPFVLMIATHA